MSRRRDRSPGSAGADREGALEPAPAEAPASGRLRWILLGAVVTLSALLVAGAFVPAPHSGGDNATYLSLAYSLLHDGSYTELFDPARLPHTKYPPVFPGLLALFMLAGARTWVAFKAVAVLSTLGAVALTYLWAERRLGAVWGAGVALLLAVSSAVVYYSHWILSDPTFLVLTLLAVWALERSDGEGAGPGWLVLGVAATGLAYFTRSAGLPLVVALGAFLALRRRWRALGATAVALGVPMLLWSLRARGAGQGEYGSEFWLVDPYDPGQGRVGPGGLLGRFWENLVGYLGTHLPGGVVGVGTPLLGVFGVALVALAVVGWVRAVRRRPGPAELFLPLYAGLILLWPAVWSGDRFVLPLYPLLFLYAALALRELLTPRGKGLASAAGAVAFLVVVLPAVKSWTTSVQDASACSAMVRRGGPFACYGPGIGSFVEAARWAGDNLPEGSAVLSRKPSMFYVLSGLPSRTFPFSDDPARHLALADEVGARYELFDQWDGLASRWVAGAVGAQPAAFCAVHSFGEEGGTVLLGIRPQDSRGDATAEEAENVRILGCPPTFTAREGAEKAYSPSSSRIPLLDGLDP
ncbi:MAG TPA: glycosyltransferase family 39 protein [Longimicrobiales bacterium]|nr:glycosyltransferase family 39 protein [Longimicrobiales bacterium]